MKKQIIIILILGVIGLGAWYLVKNTQPVSVQPENPGDASGTMLAGSSVPLEGTTFRLVQYNSSSLTGEVQLVTPDDSNYTLMFDGTRLSAHFCNQMGGDYSVDGNVITAPRLVSTLMFCESPAGLMDMETGFGKVMAEGARFNLEGDLLEIWSESGEYTFFYNVPSVIAQ